MHRIVGTVLLALLLLSVPLAGAAVPPPGAGDALVVAGPGAYLSSYVTPLVVLRPGQPATFVNLDVKLHDVVAREDSGSADQPWCDVAPQTYDGGCPLFWSALVGTAEAAPVLGLEFLEPGGTYRYFCSLHQSMEGQFLVVAS